MTEESRTDYLPFITSLAVVVGVFSLIRGGLWIYGGMNPVLTILKDWYVSILGLLSIVVGGIAIAASIAGFRRAGNAVKLIKRYAWALVVFNIVWIGSYYYHNVTIHFLICLVDISIGLGTLYYIKKRLLQ